jgi:hypothetical protein
MLFEHGSRFSGWFATHPPLLERIRALEPGFDPRDLPAASAAPPEGAADDERAPGTAALAGATAPAAALEALDASYTQAVTEMVMRGVPGTDDQTGYLIQLCLNELLQNVFEWAESPMGCTVLARWYHKTRSVRLAVVDRGIGIPAALRRHKVRGLHRSSDAEVIIAAVTTPQLTSRQNRVGGLGLKTIREEIARRKGRLTIVSLGAKVVWTDQRSSHYQAFPLRGTAVEIDFRPTHAISDPGEYVPVF